MLGESMKYVDLELVEPITGEAYQVQVKSKSSVAEFKAYAKASQRKAFASCTLSFTRRHLSSRLLITALRTWSSFCRLA